MLARRTRRTLPVLVATAGLVLVGCGGGGDEDAYVETYERACKKITASATSAQGELLKLGSPGRSSSPADIAKIRETLATVLGTFGEQVEVLGDADAPGKWSSFQESVSDDADEARETVEKAKGQLGEIKTRADLPKAVAVFQSLRLRGSESTDIPDDLASRARTCTALLGTAGA